jgi:hypothetical protein
MLISSCIERLGFREEGDTEPLAVIVVTVAGTGTASCEDIPRENSCEVVGVLALRFQNGLFSGADPK